MSSFTKLDIIFITFSLILTIGFVVLLIIILVKKPKKRPEDEVQDVIILSFTSLDFIQVESRPNYTEVNLGLAGRLIFDCYTGLCPKKEYYYDIDDDLTYDYFDRLDYICSEQCSYNGKSDCKCDDPIAPTGKCSEKYDDIYEDGKYCYADNVIYFWRGKKYTNSNNEVFTYYKNARLKNEECLNGTKSCGIIDDNENKLCIKSSSTCPINYISEKKLNEDKNHSSILFGNRTI